ncbi:hypothetical protein ACJJTC_019431 [Scirpophaga incertulas]
MASRTVYTVSVLVLVILINRNQCDSDVRTEQLNSTVEIKAVDSVGTNVTRLSDIEPEKTLRNVEMQSTSNDTSNDNEVKLTTATEEYTTTETPIGTETMKADEIPKLQPHTLDNTKNNVDEIATIMDATESIVSTLAGLDNHVYKRIDEPNQDIYQSPGNNERMEFNSTLPPPTTTPAQQTIQASLKSPENAVDPQGQRSPKTDNTKPPPTDARTLTPKPESISVLSKSRTLKAWLEDSWIRSPAGILVPLRPSALNRALAVWNDLTEEGLDISDIVIVGYDSNGVNWRSRHSLQPSSAGSGARAVSEALSKLLLKYQDFNANSEDGTMRALASAAKLVPYDSALFVVTDRGPADLQRLPLALRALVQKRLKVYTIWTDPDTSSESIAEFHEMSNISRHTEGDVLPYSIQVMDMEDSGNMASVDENGWGPTNTLNSRHGRVNSQLEADQYETLLVRRGGGEALSLGVAVENGVSALRIFIEGAVEHAVLYPPNSGPQIDLYNTTSVSRFSKSSRTEGFNPRDVILVFPGQMMETDMLSVIPASPPASDGSMVGLWHLSIKCDSCDYRLRISARALLHFDIENEKPDMLKFRITGPVSSVRDSTLIDEYGTELAKLSYSYPPLSKEAENAAESLTTELLADVPLPNVKGSRVYAQIAGRDIKGEPFVRLAGPLAYQSRMGRSASLVFPDSRNDLELVEEANLKAHYAQLQYNDSNILPNNRAMSQVSNHRGSLLTSVQIGLSSKLYGSPGDNLQLHFEVTNYRERSVFFSFQATGEQRFLTGINPTSQTILSGQTQNVIVSLRIPLSAQPGARDLITFTANGIEEVSIPAYVYVTNPGQSIKDVWPPEVRHSFQGSCIGRMDDSCDQHVWSATVVAKDAVSGLLRLSSSPVGLSYDSNFVSGSRQEVVAVYRATCCAPRLAVTAVDALGNANTYVLDISNHITEAGIAAIVLGVFLFIALLVLTVALIYWCVRRRKESRELPYSTSSRNLS